LTIAPPSLNLYFRLQSTYKGGYALEIDLTELELRVPQINFLLI